MTIGRQNEINKANSREVGGKTYPTRVNEYEPQINGQSQGRVVRETEMRVDDRWVYVGPA